MSEEEILHHRFKCTLCGTGIRLPLCCKKGTFKIVDNNIQCDMCGSNENVPICCDMKANYEGVE